jgi:hypothetical protein
MLKMLSESASKSPFSSFSPSLNYFEDGSPLLNSFIPLYRSLMFLFSLLCKHTEKMNKHLEKLTATKYPEQGISKFNQPCYRLWRNVGFHIY